VQKKENNGRDNDDDDDGEHVCLGALDLLVVQIRIVV
jgi:hypothetical protein